MEPPLPGGRLSIKTPMFSPKLIMLIQFDLCNQDTTQLRTAFVSPKGVLNRVVPQLHILIPLQILYF
jgi:hypothetical protein